MAERKDDSATPDPRPDPSGASLRRPQWYQDAVVYQLHVRSYADSDGDGIGDFDGLTERLDYLANLGVTAVWLLPFYPSPLRDDGYDIADYAGVNPAYGDLKAFRRFLREAHRRGLQVITELVINHTSDQHEWFQRARRAQPGSQARNFYVWSDTQARYQEARIIFQDFERSNWTWDEEAGAYYWHRFYHHQPDLNFEEPAVQRAVIKAMDFWFKMGVDGMRLDAVPYLYERDGTSCENLPETHAFLKTLRSHVDRRFDHRMLLAEANQWPEDAAAYFGDGDECHMAFHFPVMPRLYMALRMEDRFPVLDILEQTPAIPESCQWATFLRNHDELTLEMVTDEDRDYMVRAYAADRQARINLGIRRRLAPLLGNDRRRIELLNCLLFSLPGTPVLYYGDEIGMGDNIYLGDRNGVRTPMQWSSDRNAGFSRANPQRLFLPVIVDPEYHYEAVNVAAQEANPNSLLWWTRRLVAVRKRYRAFSRGDLEFLYPKNHKVLAFLRRCGDERLLVVANLSRYVQHVELDLAAADRELEGMTPVEVFGRTPFPRIGEWPYLLTLGPHGFYWFVLERERLQVAGRPVETAPDDGLPVLDHPGDWHALLQGDGRRALEAALGRRLADHPAFGGALRAWRGAAVRAAVPLTDADRGVDAALVLLEIEYTDGEPELYGLLLACAAGEDGERVVRAHRDTAYLRLRGGATTADAVIHDALLDRGVAVALFAALRHRRRFRDGGDELTAVASSWLRQEAGADTDPVPHFGPGDGSTVVLGERWVLRMLRRLEPGANPGLELARYLEAAGFPHTPRTGGWLELRHQDEPRRGAAAAMTRAAQAPVTVAVLQEFVRNQGSAGAMARDAAGRFFERVLARRVEGEVPPPADAADAVGLVERARLWRAAENGDPTAAPTGGAQGELLGPFPEAARQLGVLTAELHRTLAAAEGDLAPEPFTTLARRSVYQSLRSAAGRHLRFLDQHLGELDDAAAAAGRDLLQRRDEVLERLAALLDCKLDSLRIRTHGHLHLGQLLSTGRGFMIVGFRGDPGRRFGERRIKSSPLTDVASLLRSLYSAADDELQRQVQGGLLGRDDVGTLGGWVGYWQRWVSAACLSSYLECVGDDEPRLVPSGSRELAVVLDVYQLERALNEMRDTLTRHPHRAAGVLTAVLDLLRERP